MGLISTLREELTVRAGMVEQTNLDTYQLLQLADTPPIEVTFVDGGDEPHGMGEPVIGPVGAAVANAVAAATGPVCALSRCGCEGPRLTRSWAGERSSWEAEEPRPCAWVLLVVAGTGFEPVTLWVMSPASYRAAPPRVAGSKLREDDAGPKSSGETCIT